MHPSAEQSVANRRNVANLSICFAILGFGLATFTHADPDLWGHLRFGLDLLASGGPTVSDRYSFTHDRLWHNHEWLSEVVMALAWKVGGVGGLVVLKAALATTAATLVWGATRGAAPVARLVVLGWLVFGTVHTMSMLRPQLWSLVGTALLARHLLAPSRLTYKLLPPAFAVWANMHGGWFVGLAILGAWIVGGGVIEPGRRGRTIALGIACAIATLATPYGIGTWTFILTTVRFERAITEWRPLWEGASVAEWAAWVGTTAVSAYVVITSRHRSLARALVLLILTWSALRIMRMGSLYVTVACVFVAPWLIARWPIGPMRPARRPRGAVVMLAVPALGAVFAPGGLAATAARCVATTGPWQPDIAVASTLRSAPPGRLLTSFEWGEFAIWHFGPSLQVSIDGRRETVYSNEHLKRHDAVLAATEEGLRTLDAWHPDYVWLPQSAPQLKAPLLSRGYYLVVESERSWLASRTPIPRALSGQSGGCFPE